MDDPDYRHAQQLQRQGRNNEALNAYLKTVANRGYGNAPESHFSAGELYLVHVKDPLEAIHHYKRFLDARGNSPQAPLVKERIATATREFARTLPARPMDDVSMRIEATEELERLRQENKELRAENSTLRGGSAAQPPRSSTRLITGSPTLSVPTTSQASTPVSVPTQEPANPFIVAPLPMQSVAAEQQPLRETRATIPQNQGNTRYATTPQPTPSRSTTATTTQPRSNAAATTPARPTGSGNTHTVRPKETMYSIARQYGVSVNDLARANGIANPSNVPIGTVLRIPAAGGR